MRDYVKSNKSEIVSPAGEALLDGRVLLSYVATKVGDGRFTAGNATRCDVTVVGRETTRLILTPAIFAYYEVFRSIAAPAPPAAKKVPGGIEAPNQAQRQPPV